MTCRWHWFIMCLVYSLTLYKQFTLYLFYICEDFECFCHLIKHHLWMLNWDFPFIGKILACCSFVFLPVLPSVCPDFPSATPLLPGFSTYFHIQTHTVFSKGGVKDTLTQEKALHIKDYWSKLQTRREFEGMKG